MANDLFSPVQLGSIALKNRIVMAPLTRNRAGENGVPNDLNVTYYAQRATAGLIITEATPISPLAHGYPALPGIYTDAQVAGWKKMCIRDRFNDEFTLRCVVICKLYG